MGLYQIWKQDIDPTDAVNPYTPYTFPDKLPTYDLGMARREAVTLIPGLDGVVSGYGQQSGPFDRRTLTVGFRVLTKHGPFAAHDLLMTAIMGEENVRLVLKTETGYLRFTPASLLNTSEPHTNDENTYFDFKATWRIRADWRPHDSEVAEVFHSATIFAAGTTFGGGGVTIITTSPQSFTVDSRGTAGTDLPTLDDTGPTITITGPCGGSSGIQVVNDSTILRDSTGKRVNVTFILPFNLPTANDSCTLRFASQSFLHNGVPFRPQKPLDANGLSYQREWFRIVRGILNQCQIIALGSSPLTGGNIKVDFWRRMP